MDYKNKHTINPAARQQVNRRKTLTVDEYVEGIRAGNRVVLSRAITLIESTRTDHHEQAQAIIADGYAGRGQEYIYRSTR